MLAHFQNPFGRSNRDAFSENEGKIHEGGCVKKFFCKLACWHRATSWKINSPQIIFRDFEQMNAVKWLLLVLVKNT